MPVGRPEARGDVHISTVDEDLQFLEGSERLFIWATDQTFSSATTEILLAPQPVDVGDWEIVYFQLDVVENTAASGVFKWAIGTAVENRYAFTSWSLVTAPVADVPVAGATSVIRASRSSSTPLRRWIAWSVQHDGVSADRVRFQIKVFLKKRAHRDWDRPPVPPAVNALRAYMVALAKRQREDSSSWAPSMFGDGAHD